MCNEAVGRKGRKMRRVVSWTFSMLIAACLATSGNAQTVPSRPSVASAALRVLFIGNSFTSNNNLPSMLTELAMSPDSSRRIQTESIAVASATLETHWKSGDARTSIQNGNFDYVILQEHSYRPIEESEKMYVYARLFDEEIKKSGARTVLFLTWSKSNEPANQALLDHAYFTLGKELNALVAPVGPAWKAALRLDPAIPLYDTSDGRHPTETGSYLAACVFYLVMNADRERCPALEHRAISGRDLETVRRSAFQAVTGLRVVGLP